MSSPSAPSPDKTLQALLLLIGAVLLFALGRWTAGDRAPVERNVVDPPADLTGLRSGIDLVIDGRPRLGAASAPVVLVEFSDFQCPFCGRHVRETIPLIKAEFLDAGQVQYVFRHLPIPSLHPQAVDSARAADCAHAQGRFWEMHDRLFAQPKGHTLDALTAHAAAVGVEADAWSTCMRRPVRTIVDEDIAAGSEAGVMGTPAFFVGMLQPDGLVRVTQTIYGAKPFATFKAALDAALAAVRSE